MATFFLFMISVTELVFWILWQVGQHQLNDIGKLIFVLIGFWGILIGYAIPPIFALLHMIIAVGKGGLGGGDTLPGYTQDLFLLIGGAVMWAGCGALHVLFVERFVNHMDATKKTCESECVAPGELGEDATDEEAEKHTAMTEKYDACMEKCAAEKELSETFECSLAKNEEADDAEAGEYEEACKEEQMEWEAKWAAKKAAGKEAGKDMKEGAKEKADEEDWDKEE